MNQSPDPAGPDRVAVILAAGEGTRMRSQRPKVLHRVAGRPILEWVLSAARASGAGRILIVVGHGADEIQAEVTGDDVVWVHQRERLGTGHALAQAERHLDGDPLLWVLNGDVPLVAPATLDRLAAAASSGWGAMAVAELDDPGALGRVVSDGSRLQRIVEAADATAEELENRQINAGIYALPARATFAELRRLSTDNAKGEYYLTDALTAAASRGEAVELVTLEDVSEGYGVNDRRDLARVHNELLRRHRERLMAGGVTLLEPERITAEPTVRVGEDTVIHPEVSLLGNTEIGRDCVVHQGAWLRDSRVADGVEIKPYSILDGAEVASGCTVGPFARLRPASVLLPGARVGNFVELKKTRLGAGSKASHLAYLGDATIGKEANIGAGVITCNYDGVHKHRTEIGDGAFVGSDTMLVAPVTVGAGATTGAGSVVTQDVPDGALAVGRSRQRNVPDWSRRARKQK